MITLCLSWVERLRIQHTNEKDTKLSMIYGKRCCVNTVCLQIWCYHRARLCVFFIMFYNQCIIHSNAKEERETHFSTWIFKSLETKWRFTKQLRNFLLAGHKMNSGTTPNYTDSSLYKSCCPWSKVVSSYTSSFQTISKFPFDSQNASSNLMILI